MELIALATKKLKYFHKEKGFVGKKYLLQIIIFQYLVTLDVKKDFY